VRRDDVTVTAAGFEPFETAGPALREALSAWFGAPLRTVAPSVG